MNTSVRQIFIFSLSRSTSLLFVEQHKSRQSTDVNIDGPSPSVIPFSCDPSLFLNLETSSIGYHQICIRDHARLCFHDDQYLCICAVNHTRVDCFLFDDQLNHCEHCLSGGRCLKGDLHRSNDFVCLCHSCYSGRQCQFNTKSFLSLSINCFLLLSLCPSNCLFLGCSPHRSLYLDFSLCFCVTSLGLFVFLFVGV